MKDYIKKFDNAPAAHNYVIIDLPFVTSVAENPIQNLVCNKTGKHLENDNGTVIICPQDLEPDSTPDSTSISVPELDFIDLGLPSKIKWCNYNFGVDVEKIYNYVSMYGDYYAWAETTIKKYYAWEDPNHEGYDYKWANGAYDKLTKYCNTTAYSNDGSTDYINEIEFVDDVVTYYYNNGNKHRIPNAADVNELISYTNKVWINNYDPLATIHKPADDGGIKGLNGILFTSTVNGNSIFIPASGYMNGDELYLGGQTVLIWTSSLADNDTPSNAKVLMGIEKNSAITTTTYERCYGLCLRPIYDPNGKELV